MLAFYAYADYLVCCALWVALLVLFQIVPLLEAYLAVLANGQEIVWIVTWSWIPVPDGIINQLCHWL